MARLAINLNYIPVTIFLFSSLLSCNLVSSINESMLSSCITSYNQTVNNQTGLIDDPYRANLLALFANFTASSLTFYNTTAGESPNKAYGLYLCRGDASSDTCRTCVASLTSMWIPTLSGCKEGVAFMDECMIHHANYSFFGRANDTVLGAQVGKPITTASQEYNQTLDSVLQDVVTDAYKSTTSYATSVAAFSEQGEQEMVYGLAQCTPDINRGDCNGCLKAAQSYLRANLTGVKSAWALLPSCQLRYDNVSFFGVSSANSSPAPASVSAFLLATFGLFFINSLV